MTNINKKKKKNDQHKQKKSFKRNDQHKKN